MYKVRIDFDVTIGQLQNQSYFHSAFIATPYTIVFTYSIATLQIIAFTSVVAIN